jgi:phosphoribosylformimino-5-aminoimidazole carboxamide ribotide isomerase
MQIIPVLDLAGGVAVHARAGDRAHYAPVESLLAPGRHGDALALTKAYREDLGATACYVADLDAIQGGPIQRTLLRELAGFEAGFAGELLVDAGVDTEGGALEVLACGTSQVIVGLETLRAFADLGRIVEAVGPSRTIFSLDLHLGQPLLHPAVPDAGTTPDPVALAARALAYGTPTLLVVDVGRVGTGCGLDLGLLEALRRELPRVRLLAGGGVLTRRDLDRMRDVGCDGALVASALHTGRLTAADLTAFTAGPDAQADASTSR